MEEEQITGISGDAPPGTSGGDESSRNSHGVSGHSGASGVQEDYELRKKFAILRKNYQPKQKYSNKIFKNNTRQK